jgi:hypothetical protein
MPTPADASTLRLWVMLDEALKLIEKLSVYAPPHLADHLDVWRPKARALLQATTARRRCGCPEQYRGGHCPACRGTGWIPPLS